MTLALRVLLVALLVYGALLAALYFGQRRLLYPAGGPAVTAGQAGLAGFEDVVLETADGERIAGWYRAPEPGRAITLYFHGNGGSLSLRAERARAMTREGRGLLIVTYRGYPGSTGSPTEEGLRSDALAAYAWLTRRFPPARIALYGESLGTGVAVRLASERPVGGLILDAPFTSTADIASRLYWFVPVSLLMQDQYRSVERIGAVKAPILVLHGTADGVVPFSLGERLFQAAPDPKRFVRIEGGGHEGNLAGPGLAAVHAFLSEVETRLPPVQVKAE